MAADHDAKRVIVRVDDRVRLLSAVLAATDYPEKSQARKRHGTHAHARGTRRLVADFSSHPAVHALQVLLDQRIPLASSFSYVLRLTWPGLESDDDMPRWVPPRWNEHLRHFYEVVGLERWWAHESMQWDTPVRHLREAFANVDLHTFLAPFVGRVVETLWLTPNICYPTDETIGLRVGSDLITVMPPPVAWGDSPPWPYKDDPALAYRRALTEFGGLLMNAYLRQHEDVVRELAEKPLPVDEGYAAAHHGWYDQFMGIFKAALVTLFFEDAGSSLEARSFTQYMQKVEQLPMLPGVVGVFRRYLEEYNAGNYPSFADYLPHLPKHLKLARTFSTEHSGTG